MKLLPSFITYLLSLACTASAHYSPRDFLSRAPAETFYTEDEISEAEKQSVARSKAISASTFTCEAWGIAEESPTSLTIKICPDSFVRIQLFHRSSGDIIVAVESNRSAGRACDMHFFNVAGPRREISKLSFEKLKALGIDEVNEIGLLSDPQGISGTSPGVVLLSLDEAGRPAATLRTTEGPRWKTSRVIYEWDGTRFHKRIEPPR